MTTEEILQELQALIAKIEGAGDGDDTERDEERMAELLKELEERRGAEEAAQSRAARVEAARAAIEAGAAQKVDDVPLARSAAGAARDTTDYAKAEKRAWLKNLATRSDVTLTGGNELSDVERRAFDHLTSNTGAVVPVELQNEIISLIDNTAVLFGDVRRFSFKHQFEIVRHTGIEAGDAAVTTEGAAPDDEQNAFERIALSGEEIKKTVRMSRKMRVQSLDGFENYLVTECGGRLAVAANAFVHARTVDATLGMADANKVSAATAGALAKADLTGLFALLYTYGNPAPKGSIVYANNSTIWNHIAMLEDANGRSYFVDEKREDPAVEGRIFGKLVKRDDSMADGVIKVGYPDLFHGNVFDGVSVDSYKATDGSQRQCYDGYLLYDGGLVVPQAFAMLTIGQAGGEVSESEG